MNKNHSFNKFSQHTHGVICEAYLLGQKQKRDSQNKDTLRVKVTKKHICSMYKISRPWFDVILARYKLAMELNCDKPSLVAKSRINKRYQTEEYKARRRQKLIDVELKKAARKAKRELIKASRYVHELPNSMFHMDLKLLPPILGEKKIPGQKQYLLNFIDDCSRLAYFEVIDGKNQWQVAAGLQRIFDRLPTTNIVSVLSDNGKEFKGNRWDICGSKQEQENAKNKTQHAVEKLLTNMGIKHYYTKVRRPQTNGKSERLNRTVNEELLTQIQFNSRLERELQVRYYEHHYNNHRRHQGINNQTPNQKYQALSLLKF